MAVTASEKLDGDPPSENPLGLDADEIALLDSQVEVGTSDAGYGAIYRYAERLDRLVMATSAVFAVVAGATMPLMTVSLKPDSSPLGLMFIRRAGHLWKLDREVHRLLHEPDARNVGRVPARSQSVVAVFCVHWLVQPLNKLPSLGLPSLLTSP